MAKSPAGIAAIDCCPPLEPCDVCDYLDFTLPAAVHHGERSRRPGERAAS